MKFNLNYRFYHLLWKLWPKKTDSVGGHNITYIVIPKWLLVPGILKSRTSNAMCLTHRPSKTIAIFISRRKAASPEFRYTLYHEYLEASHFLGLVSGNEALKAQFKEAVFSLLATNPEVSQALENAIKRKRQKGHFFALIMELALAKKEMPSEMFSEHLANALKNRI